MARMETYYPTRKVIAGTLASAITTVVIWVVENFVLDNTKIPSEITGSILTIVTAIVGWSVAPSPNDQVVK